MLKGKISAGLTTLLFAAMVVAAAGMVQAAGGPPAGGAGGGARRFGRGNFNPAQFRQMIMQRFKDMLGAKDDEWTVIEPKLQKVMDLSGQLRGRGMRGMFRRGGRGGAFGRNAPQGGGPAAKPTELEKATTDLQTTLQDPQAKSDVIKQKLSALRAAREKVRQQLDKASADLKSVLTVRQEAMLVMDGMLE